MRKEKPVKKKVQTIKDIQRKKERGQTNEEFYEWVSSQEPDFEQATIVVQRPNGEVTTYYSQNGSLPLLGMLDIAKQQVLDDMRS
ncbi:hypothetical protein QP736_08025 [Enterococcus faecalis]|uniref:hypothetical protein n=1 Tax=Enterococcus faecalis TaxID=1351 RepID=UPI0021CB0664|nr:hypothetical protein [Enterococcus faecalis]MDK8204806.1 hypothetical protein [Enterococcus faecalis]MDU4367538.1 hypothetical protein [Enterococcus faecalis]MDU6499826.1 hypothetical protein [Enterococcus faecalis]MDV2597632.1 hypothetical protein [Enterococcus faecalis]